MDSFRSYPRFVIEIRALKFFLPQPHRQDLIERVTQLVLRDSFPLMFHGVFVGLSGR